MIRLRTAKSDKLGSLISFNRLECFLYREATGFLAKFNLDDQLKIVVIMSNHFVATPEEASRVQATFGFEGNSQIVQVQLGPSIFFRTNQVT